MPERLTQAQRSRTMAAVKSRDTRPEMIVRRLVHRLGYRFRLHGRDLPGTPDIIFPRLHKVINVHGCFWHMHICQRRRRNPVNNAGYWKRKRAGNVARDRRNLRRLRRAGWRVLTIWECQTRDLEKLGARLEGFLRPDHPVPASGTETQKGPSLISRKQQFSAPGPPREAKDV